MPILKHFAVTRTSQIGPTKANIHNLSTKIYK